MPKAYSYIRFSTLEQSKGDSLRRQTALSEKFALENNLELDKTLNLNDFGISAYDSSNITKGALGVASSGAAFSFVWSITLQCI